MSKHPASFSSSLFARSCSLSMQRGIYTCGLGPGAHLGVGVAPGRGAPLGQAGTLAVAHGLQAAVPALRQPHLLAPGGAQRLSGVVYWWAEWG